MQDRFDGHIGDYLKLSILRRLSLEYRWLHCSAFVQVRLECNMVTPVTDRAVAKTRLKSSAETTGANRAPSQAEIAWAGAMHAHIVISMLPTSRG